MRLTALLAMLIFALLAPNAALAQPAEDETEPGTFDDDSDTDTADGPTEEPTDEPTDDVTEEPTDDVTQDATEEPTDGATGEPTEEATAEEDPGGIIFGQSEDSETVEAEPTDPATDDGAADGGTGVDETGVAAESTTGFDSGGADSFGASGGTTPVGGVAAGFGGSDGEGRTSGVLLLALLFASAFAGVIWRRRRT